MIRKNKWRLLDLLKRKTFLKYEIRNLILTGVSFNSSTPLTYRYYALFNKSKTIRWYSITQQKNKCIQTGRVWSTVKGVKYSRFVFRNEAYSGNLPGFKRASW